MLALLNDGAPRLVHDYPRPTRTAGEVLIHTRVAGICDTDLQLARGYMQHRGVLGHEFVGDVHESEGSPWQGRRVVADINAGCGVCDECRLRLGHHCATRTVLGIVARDGALAEYFAVPAHTLIAVPDNVTDEHAVFAEPLAAALHVLDAIADVSLDGGPVVVLGDGKLGTLITLALRSANVRVLAVGRHAHKLAIARNAGAETAFAADVNAATLHAPAVVEATGTAEGISTALSMVRPRGSVVLKTTIAGATSVDLSPVVIHELRVVGSRCGDLSRAMQVLATGAVDPTPLIEARYPLQEADVALAHAARKGTMKVLVQG